MTNKEYTLAVDLPETVVDVIATSAGYFVPNSESFYRFAHGVKDEVIARLPLHCFSEPRKKLTEAEILRMAIKFWHLDDADCLLLLQNQSKNFTELNK